MFAETKQSVGGRAETPNQVQVLCHEKDFTCLSVNYAQVSFSAKFRLKLKKVGKTTRPFRYDLNQIPYDYTVEVTNRFKGSDLIECLKNYGWRFVTLCRRQ